MRAGLAITEVAADADVERVPIRVGVGIHADEVDDGEHSIVSSAVN